MQTTIKKYKEVEYNTKSFDFFNHSSIRLLTDMSHVLQTDNQHTFLLAHTPAGNKVIPSSTNTPITNMAHSQ